LADTNEEMSSAMMTFQILGAILLTLIFAPAMTGEGDQRR